MKNRLKELKKLSKDALIKELWKGNDQFADFFNALVYHCQQIRPDELSDTNTDLSTLIAEPEFAKTIRRYRDAAKLSKSGACYQILAIENQASIHYAMPFRCLLYDVLRNGFKDIPKELSSMNLETAYIAASLTGTEAQLDTALQESSNKGKETIDMCNAVVESLKEEREKGYAAGEAEGEARGEAKGEAKMKKAILSLHMNGMKIETISKMTGLSLDEVKSYVL